MSRRRTTTGVIPALFTFDAPCFETIPWTPLFPKTPLPASAEKVIDEALAEYAERVFTKGCP